ncbi:RNA polymerase II mediator complex subunit [Agyrium rufum]|nr:RNA polymerase II mediator complex subunit [Agyrium rufum]
MTDRLTQLQDSLDQVSSSLSLSVLKGILSTQLYASLRYVLNHAPPSSLPSIHSSTFAHLIPTPSNAAAAANDPNAPTPPAAVDLPSQNNRQEGQSRSQADQNLQQNQQQQQQQQQPIDPADPLHRPDSPTTFDAAQRELAQDLVLKQQQIEILIKGLPDISPEDSEARQISRITELEMELREVWRERDEVVVREKEELLERVEGVLASVGRGM